MSFYAPDASADRQEYQAAVSGGYSDRLADIFAQAAERAAAAAEEARNSGMLPPWMYDPRRTPGYEGPSILPADEYPLVQPPENPLGGPSLRIDPNKNYLAPEGATMVDDYDAARAMVLAGKGEAWYPVYDPVSGNVERYETVRLEDALPVGAVVADDYEAARILAIAGNTEAYYLTPSGYVKITPGVAYRDSLEDIPDAEPSPVQTTPTTTEGTGDKGYPDRFQYDELTGEILLSPQTGEPLPPAQVFLGFDTTQVDGPPGSRVEVGMNPVFYDTKALKNFSAIPRDLVDQIVAMANAYYGRPVDPSWIRSRWAEAIDEAAGAYQLNGALISPLEVYEDLIAASAVADAASSASSGGGYYGSGGGGGTSSVRLTNYTSAKAILNAAMSAFLGRQASDAEISNFLKLLNEQEMANPVTQEFSGTIALQSGGFDPQQFAEDFAKSQDGAGEYQAVTTYLDAFLAALGGGRGVL